MAEISCRQVIDWRQAVGYLEQSEAALSKEELAKVLEGLCGAEEALSRLEDIADRLRKRMPQLPVQTRELLHACLVAIKGVELLQQIGLWIGAKEAPGRMAGAVDGVSLAAELEEWFLFYKEVWRRTSRESELYRVQNVIFRFADLLRG